jgi:hypothetical protein
MYQVPRRTDRDLQRAGKESSRRDDYEGGTHEVRSAKHHRLHAPPSEHMKKPAKYSLLALVIFTVLGVIYVMNFGLFPRYFDLGWDEEVRLHNGRTMIVHITRKFERYGLRLERWRGTYRATEISFDAGAPLGRLVKRFERYQVDMVEFRNGNWYLALSDTSGTPPKRIVSERIPVLIVGSDGSERAAKSWEEVPDFPRQNVMPLTPSEEAVKHFDGTLLTWDRKMAHWRQYPRAAGDNGKVIQRHPQGNQGVEK